MLCCHDVTFAYRPGRPVLDGVTLAAGPGITAILGANGAGKSTLLRVLAGLARPDTGSVRLGDLNVSELSARHRARRIAYIAQQPAVGAALTVRQVVALSRVVIGASDRAVDAAIERASLTDLAAAPFHALSAGQQQRVMLARATAQLLDASGGPPPPGPAALLADEPISAQDPRFAAGAVEILRELARSICVVIVVHDPTLARRVADHAVLLTEQGTLLIGGDPGEVVTAANLERIYGVGFEESRTVGPREDGGGGGVVLFPRMPPRV